MIENLISLYYLQLCRRVRGNGNSAVHAIDKSSDDPPSYEEFLKSEIPPPAYYSVVVESPKDTTKKSPFSLPKVFGGSSSPPSPNNQLNTKDVNLSKRSPTISSHIAGSFPKWKPMLNAQSLSCHEQHRPSTSRSSASTLSEEPILQPIYNTIGVVEEFVDNSKIENNSNAG